MLPALALLSPLFAFQTTGPQGPLPPESTPPVAGTLNATAPGGTAIAQVAYLKAAVPDVSDVFGASTALSGDLAAVGAYWEDSAATGVQGNPSDNSAPNSGAVYVFERSSGTWTPQAYIKASNTDADDEFGLALALSGDTLVVGANHESSSATGINGNEADNSAQSSGAVYVFVRTGGTWVQQAYLKASNSNAFDRFGLSVAISGDTLAVGAIGESSSATGINGSQIDNSATAAGAVYIFVRTGTTWTQQAYIKASNAETWDAFGYAVDLEQDRLVVTAIGESSSAAGVNGQQSDNSLLGSGAAYVFDRAGALWTQVAYLKGSPPAGGSEFGSSVALSSDSVCVGSHYEQNLALGVNGVIYHSNWQFSGAAHVYAKTGSTWTHQAYIKATNSQIGDFFGESVALEGDHLFVGAHGEDSDANGLNGDPKNNGAPQSGAVYHYERSQGVWRPANYLKAALSGFEDSFGLSVDIDGSLLLVGASAESGSSSGVGGDQADDGAQYSGAAYVFDLDASGTYGSALCSGDGTAAPCPCNDFAQSGEGCKNSTGLGTSLTGLGFASVSTDALTLAVDNSLPGGFGLMFQGSMTISGGLGASLGNGILCVASEHRWSVATADSAGCVAYGPNLFGGHPAAVPGATLNYQWWYRDVADPCGGGFNFSNAWTVTWAP